MFRTLADWMKRKTRKVPHVNRPRRLPVLEVERLEDRLVPAIGSTSVGAPVIPGTLYNGVGYDGVTQLLSGGGLGSGALIQPGGGHYILTVMHNDPDITPATLAAAGPGATVGGTQPASVIFNLQRNGAPVNITIPVAANAPVAGSPPSAATSFVINNPYAVGGGNNDIALWKLTDPNLPAAQQANSLLVAPFGAQQYQLSAATPANNTQVNFVGYGTTGTAANGQGPSNISTSGTKRIGTNSIDGSGALLQNAVQLIQFAGTGNFQIGSIPLAGGAAVFPGAAPVLNQNSTKADVLAALQLLPGLGGNAVTVQTTNVAGLWWVQFTSGAAVPAPNTPGGLAIRLAPNQVTGLALGGGGTLVTVTTGAANNFVAGQPVTMANISAFFNNTFTISNIVSPTQFQITLPAAAPPGAIPGGGLVALSNVVSATTPTIAVAMPGGGTQNILGQTVPTWSANNLLLDSDNGNPINDVNNLYYGLQGTGITAQPEIQNINIAGAAPASTFGLAFVPTTSVQIVGVVQNAGTQVTVTTNSPMNYSVNQQVTIAGIGPGYNGTFVVTGAPAVGVFTYNTNGAAAVPTPPPTAQQLFQGPGVASAPAQVTAAINANATPAQVQAALQALPALAPSLPPSPGPFTITQASETNNTVTITTGATITAMSLLAPLVAGGPQSVHVTTSAANGFVVGSQVVISGVVNGAGVPNPLLNGQFTVTAVGANTFDFSFPNIGAAVGAAAVNIVAALGLNIGNAAAALTTVTNPSVGQFVTISGIAGAANQAYNGTFQVLGSTRTSFTYLNPVAGLPAVAPGAVGMVVQASNSIMSAIQNGNTVTIATQKPNGFVVGQVVTISGVTSVRADGNPLAGGDTGYNGTFTITNVFGNSFQYARTAAALNPAPAAPGLNATAGTGAAVIATGFAVTNLLNAGGTVTVNTTAATQYAVGQIVTFTGVSVAGYNNVSFQVASVNGTQFTFVLPAALAALGNGLGGTVTTTGAPTIQVTGGPGAWNVTFGPSSGTNSLMGIDVNQLNFVNAAGTFGQTNLTVPVGSPPGSTVQATIGTSQQGISENAFGAGDSGGPIFVPGSTTISGVVQSRIGLGGVPPDVNNSRDGSAGESMSAANVAAYTQTATQITAAARAGNVATITTAGAGQYSSGQEVVITGVPGFNGTWIISNVNAGANTISFNLPTFTVTALANAAVGTVVTITTSAPNNLQTGQLVSFTNVTVGAAAVVNVPITVTSPTTFTFDAGAAAVLGAAATVSQTPAAPAVAATATAAGWITATLAANNNANLVLDMNFQVVGQTQQLGSNGIGPTQVTAPFPSLALPDPVNITASNLGGSIVLQESDPNVPVNSPLNGSATAPVSSLSAVTILGGANDNSITINGDLGRTATVDGTTDATIVSALTAGTPTITTAGPNNFVVGQSVTLNGLPGTWGAAPRVVTAVISPTVFQIGVVAGLVNTPAAPAAAKAVLMPAAVVGATAAGEIGTNALITVPNTFLVNQWVTITGLPGFNGVFQITAATPNNFSFVNTVANSAAITAAPGATIAGATVTIANRLVINAPAGSTYTVTATTIQRTGGSLINYSNFQVVVFNTTAGNNTVNITATPPGCRIVVLSQGGGTNTINVGGAALPGSTLANVAGPVIVRGAAGTTTNLNVNDRGAAAGQNYTVTNNSVTRGGGVGAIEYFLVDNLVLNTSPGATTNVQTTKAGTATSVIAVAGVNNVTVGSAANSLAGIAGPLTVTGAAGATTNLSLNDQGGAAGQNYTVTNSSVTRGGIATISYSLLNNLVLFAANASATNVRSTSADTVTTIQAGLGVSSVNVGNGNLAGIAGNVIVLKSLTGASTVGLVINDLLGDWRTNYTDSRWTVLGVTLGFVSATPTGLATRTIFFAVDTVTLFQAVVPDPPPALPPGTVLVQADTTNTTINNDTGATVQFDRTGALTGPIAIENPGIVAFSKGFVSSSIVSFPSASSLDVEGGMFDALTPVTAYSADVVAGILKVAASQTLAVTSNVDMTGGVTNVDGGNIIDVGNFSQSGTAVLKITLANNEPTPVVDFGQVTLAGILNLNAAAGFSPAPGTVITLIQDAGPDPVNGQFLGLPEGTTVDFNNVSYIISYHGGSNKQNVVLTAQSASSDPIANYIADTLGEGQTSTINLVANGSDSSGAPLTATIVTPPSQGSVQYNSTTGLFTYTPTSSTYTGLDSFTYDVSDGSDVSNVAEVAIDVVPVNQAPSGTGNTVTVTENSSYTFSPSDFGFTDPNTPADTFKAVEITTLPAAGSLTDNGVSVSAGQFVNIADLLTGGLVFTPAIDASGTSYAGFTFQVQDDGSTTYGGATIDPSPKTMTLNVSFVDQPPVGASHTVTTLENAPYVFQASDFGFSDPNNSPATSFQAVEITTLPSNGTLTDNGVSVAVGSFVSVADINANKLIYTPATDASGSAYDSFTFQVQNSGGTANGGVDTDPTPRTMTINVTWVNQAPVGTSGKVSTEENTPYTFAASDFGFTDPNDPAPNNSLLAVEITTLPSNGALTDNGAPVTAGQFISAGDIDNGLLIYTPPANTDGLPVDSFTFQVRNDGGTANGGMDTDPAPKTMSVSIVQPAQWVVTGEPPTTAPADGNFSLSVSAEDSLGDVDAAYDGTVLVSVLSGPGSLTDQFGDPGPIPVTVNQGIGAVGDLDLTTAGTYVLQVVSDPSDSDPLSGTTTTSITVQADNVVQLVVTSQPSTTSANGTFSLSVVGEDQFGNVVPYSEWDNSNLGVSIASGPSTATLSGPSSIQVNSTTNIVTFQGLSLDTVGAYTLSINGTDNYGDPLLSATSSTIIVQGTPVISWSHPTDITYGTALGSAQLDAATSVPGTFSYTLADGVTNASGALLSAGQNQVLNVTFTPTDTTDYTTATAQVQINVGQAMPTFFWSNPADITYGTALGSTQLDATSTLAGTLSYTLADGVTNANGAVLPAGQNQVLEATFTPADTTDYTTATVTVSINVAAATPSVSVVDNGGSYTGSAFPATATVNGGASLEGVYPTLAYYSGSSAAGASSSSAPTTVGTYTVVANFPGSADYGSASSQATFSITYASTWVAVTDNGGAYNGSTYPGAATVDGRPDLEGVYPTLTYYSGTGVSGTSSSMAPSAVGTYTVLATFPGSADYSSGTSQATFVITGTDVYVSVQDNGGTFNGGTFPATTMVDGGASLEGVYPTLAYYSGASAFGSSSSSAPSTAGTYTVVATFPGSADYGSGSSQATFSITGAATSVTVTDNGGTYNGATFPATAMVDGGMSLEGVFPTLAYYSGSSAAGPSSSNAPSTAGTYTVVANFPGSTDYGSASSQAMFSITAAAAPSVAVSDSGGTFNGSAFSAAATVNGGASLEGVAPTLAYYSGSSAAGTSSSSAPSSVGTYTVVATFPGSSDYGSASSQATFSITDAAASVAVSDSGGTFNGSAFSATATVNGGASLEGVAPTLAYYSGSSAAGTSSSSAPSAAGTYTVVATFAGSSDYGSASSQATFSITDTAASVAVLDSGGTYNGSTFPATATVNGGASLEGVAPTLAYYSGSSAAGTSSSSAPSAAGTYTVVATFAGSSDYGSASSQATFSITDAAASVAVSDSGGTYNGSTFPATATVNGGASLEGVAPTLAYYSGSSAAGTSSSSAPSAAGTYTVVATFAGSSDYGSASSQATFSITDAAAPSVAVSDSGGTYNGSAFSATATVNGGASLEGVAPTLAYYSGSSASGTSSSSAPSTAGTYTVVATFPGSTDYGSASSQATFYISSAATTVTVSDNGGTYNGSAFPATAMVNGAASLEGGVTPTLAYYAGSSASGTSSSSAPSAAGTYTVVANFPGSTDYQSASSQTTFSISSASAPPTVAVSDSGGTFNGSAFAAMATVNGGASLEGVAPTLAYYSGSSASGTSSSSAPSAAGTYTVVANFPGSTDYQSGSSQATFSISKASTTVAVSDSGGTYNGSAFAASAAVDGAASLQGVAPTLAYYSGTSASGTSSSSAPSTPGTYTVVAAFPGSTDFNSGSSQATFSISKASTSVAVSDSGGTYNGSAFAASAAVDGAASLDGVAPTLAYYSGSSASGTSSSSAPSAPGTYTVVATFPGSTDFNNGSSQATFSISKASTSVAVSDSGGTYNGSAFAASATVNGGASLDGVSITLAYYAGISASGTSSSIAPSAAGTYTVVATYAGNLDYFSSSSQATFTIS